MIIVIMMIIVLGQISIDVHANMSRIYRRGRGSNIILQQRCIRKSLVVDAIRRINSNYLD